MMTFAELLQRKQGPATIYRGDRASEEESPEAVASPSYDHEYMGDLWYLDSINEIKVHNLCCKIKALEWELGINRIRSPHVRRCAADQADITCQDGDSYRFLRDHFEDAIEVAASHVLHSYRQLPDAISMEDSLYLRNGNKVRRDYVWTVAVYGAEISGIAERATQLLGDVRLRTQESRVSIRMADNSTKRPACAIMEAVIVSA